MRRFFPTWQSNQKPLYNFSLSYTQNFVQGPFCDMKRPSRSLSDKSLWSKLFDYSVASRIGVPAGPLLNSNWLKLAADFGFDILTYTATSYQKDVFLPNVVYVEPSSISKNLKEIPLVTAKEMPPLFLEELTVAHTFSKACFDKEFLLKDLHKAKQYLHEGQLLIISIQGQGDTEVSFMKELSSMVSMIAEINPHAIELDFSSCIKDNESVSIDFMKRVLDKLIKRCKQIPLIVKLGRCLNPFRLRDTIIAAAKAGALGICGIYPVQVKVCSSEGLPFWSLNQRRTRMHGAILRKEALAFVRVAAYTIATEKLDMTLLGTGGIVTPDHLKEFLSSGADVALSGIGMIYDPLLAARFHSQAILGKR